MEDQIIFNDQKQMVKTLVMSEVEKLRAKKKWHEAITLEVAMRIILIYAEEGWIHYDK